MKSYKHFVFIVLTLFITAFSVAFGQLYTYKNLSHRDGLPVSSTWALFEKNDGGILIGTSGAGIIEYDGYAFKELIAKGEDNLHIVTGITVVNDTIYFTSKFKGLYRLGKNGRIHLLKKSADISYCNDVFSYNNKLYIVTDLGILEYTASDKKSKSVLKLAPNHYLNVHQIAHSEENVLIFSDQGNYILDAKGTFKSLDSYFNSKEPFLKTAQFGYAKNGLIYLFKKDVSAGWIVENKQGKLNYKSKQVSAQENTSAVQFTHATYNRDKDCFALFCKDGSIYEERKFNIVRQPRNTNFEELNFKQVVVDYNGDYWASTDLYGIFKISIQAFTKIETYEEFKNSNITFIHRTPFDNLIFCTFRSETYSGNPKKGPLKSHHLRLFSSTTIENRSIVGSSNGILEYLDASNSFRTIKIAEIAENDRIQFISYQAPYFWVNIYNKGVLQFDKNFKLVKDHTSSKNCPAIVYTGQISHDGKQFYFGTSGGICIMNIEKSTFTNLDSQNLGTYCGLSTKDIFGTNWFSLDQGIIGISRQGEIFKLSSPKIFPSYLFYTLNSDNNGNLIVGTNKGINVIQINEQGKVLNYRNYNSGTDFEGYETHMRSSFQMNNSTYVGTLEGMYKLDFDLLGKMPYPKLPSILIEQSYDENKANITSVRFISKNPKTKTVLYSYRLVNHNNTWSEVSPKNEFSFINLSGGEYVLEVKASYNGANFSRTASYPISIEKPYLRNNLIVIGFILIVIFANGYFYFKSKRNETLELFYSEEYYTTQKYSELLIIFGIIVHLTSNLLAPLITRNITINHELVLLTGGVMILCLISVYQNKKSGKRYWVKFYSVLSFLVMMAFNVYSLHASSLHPSYAFMLLLISSVSSLVFEKLRNILIYAAAFLTITIYVILSTYGYHYDKYLLIIPFFISALLSVFFNMIRHHSFHQLAFIATIINRSHFIAMAMDREGKLKYVSKNISNYINATSIDLLDKPISAMNSFIASDDGKNLDIIANFSDGKRFIAPILNQQNEVIWFEWSCKEFSEDVKVLIGEDITEKINIQNTYEILVENAEDLIYQADIFGNFEFLNNRFTHYMDVDKQSLIGKNVFDIIPSEYRKPVIAFYKDQLQTNKKVSYYELPIIDAKGQMQWLGQYVSLLYSVSDKEKVVGFLVVARNITQKLKQDVLIANQSTDIKSSINYAKRIQMNLLPAQSKFKQYFEDSFVYYKPKDIVSGDFYWCNQLGDNIIVAVGDGTGHGVPGAFMSILGINLLNSIILENHIHDPGTILDELDERLRHMLQEGNQQKINDGMEITICVYNPKNNTLEYACAGSKIMIHDGENFSIRKGDNKHIGDDRPDFKNYVTHYYDINSESTIYMFTDGFYDQFGSVTQKKYSIRRLLELLITNISLPLQNQLSVMSNEFESWKGNEEQTDDVTLVGIRLQPKKQKIEHE